MKLIFLASKELSWLWNLGFHFPKLDYHQWLRVHIFSIWEIHTYRRIQHVLFIVKTVCYLRKKLSRDLGSPGSRQLLQLQQFLNFLKFWTLLVNFILPRSVLDCWTLLLLCYSLRLNWVKLLNEYLYLLMLMTWAWFFDLWMISLFAVESLSNCESGP